MGGAEVDPDIQAVTDIGFEIIVALVLVLAIVSIILFGLLRSGRYQPSVGLVISLSLLAVLAMAGFAATQQETFGTIAATAVGALAGAVSAIWTKPPPDLKPEETERP